MKKYILVFISITAIVHHSLAQNTLDSAIDLGTISSAIDFSDTRNTNSYTDNYQSRDKTVQTRDVFYKFTLTRPLNAVISHCGSELNYTYIFLLKQDAYGGIEEIDLNYECWDYGDRCADESHTAYMKKTNLAAGTYYVVSEGESGNGNITTNIRIFKEGDSRQDPVKLGPYEKNFRYTDSQNTAEFTNQFNHISTSDVFYRLTIEKKMYITATHCESGLASTYMSLLDSNGSLIEQNDNYSGEEGCASSSHSFIQRLLDPGTYFIVSEGRYENGNVTTGITGYLYEDFGYPEGPSPYSAEPETTGSVDGVFEVSAMGGANFTVPLEVPPGVNGMQPALAIGYNSQTGNGLAGWGCNITGISVITRAPGNIYYDGKANGIGYGASDAFILDGQRLILVSGTAGSEGAVYSPESDPFTKVTLRGTYNSTVANRWFEVEASDGMKYYYGSTPASRQSYTSAVGEPRIASWYISYVEDLFGNYMEYSYSLSGNFLYPQTITYGKNKNGSNALVNTVSFEFETRNDITPFIMEGVKGSVSHRLKTITAKGGDGTVSGTGTYRIYSFTYNDTGDGTAAKFSRLTSITAKNQAGEAMKPVKLNWSYLPAFSQSFTNTSVVNNNFHLVDFAEQIHTAADMNGDGLSDLIGIYSYKAPATLVAENFAHVRFASVDASGNVTFGPGDLFNIGASLQLDNNWKMQIGGFSSIDIDGDGINELLVPRLVIEKSIKYIDFQFFSHNWPGNDKKKAFGYELRQSSEMPVYAIGDINNDGKHDIVLIEKGNAGNVYPGAVYGLQDDGKTLYQATFGVALPSAPEKMFISDFNGNGLNDVLIFYKNGYAIVWNSGGGISNATFSDTDKTQENTIGNVWMIREGDFNGDGLTDFIMNATGDNKWYFALNNGDGTFTKQEACTLEIYDHDFTDRDDERFNCFVFDFDGDGKSDVVINKAMYTKKSDITGTWGEFSKTYTFWLRSNGSSLTQVASATSNIDNDAKSGRFALGDFNGDGMLQLINYGSDCSSGNHTNATAAWKLYKNNNFNAGRGKITSIENGYGAVTTINYASLPGSGIYWKDGVESDYPLADYTLPLHAVKTVKTDAGMAINYSYSGIKAHLQGKGLIGMMSFTADNTTLGIISESGIDVIDKTFFVPKSTFERTTAGGKTASSSLSLDFSNKGSKKYFPYPSIKTEIDMDGNSTRTTYLYNTTYGYLRQEKVEDANSNMYKTVQYDDFVIAGGRYRPQTVTYIQKHADDTETFTINKKLTYSLSKGYIRQVIDNYGSSLPLTTIDDYDEFGNLIYSGISGEGAAAYNTCYEYDASKRFITKIYTNPSSEIKTFTYDIRGNLLTEKDETYASNILTTTHTYDNWGKRISTVYPDGTKTVYSSGWGKRADSRFFTLTQGKGMPWVKTWYDKLGRETVSETVGPLGIKIKTVNAYNEQGLLRKVESAKGDITTVERYTYDERGRLKTYSGNSGETVYNYEKRKTTVTTNGRNYIKTYDAWGNIKTSSDPASSVSYTYKSVGKPHSIQAGGSTWTITYDDAGRQHSLEAPHSAKTTRTYDAAGRVTVNNSTNLKKTTHEYDALGRIKSSVMPGVYGHSTTYTYGTSGYNMFRLTKVQEDDNYISYTYDKYGRKATETRYVSGTGSFTYSYSYDELGRLCRTTYPGSLYVYRYYDAYGYLDRVVAGTQTIWQRTGNTGKKHASVLGGSITSVREYDEYGFLASQKTTAGSKTILAMAYNFERQTGNLKSRTGMISQTETFTYDNLDRLTTVKHGSTETMRMTYQANGNIDAKTGLGQYTYLSPYAIRAVENTSELVPFTRQGLSYKYENKAFNISQYLDDNTDDRYVLRIDYGPGEQRYKSELRKNATTGTALKRIVYAGNYEQIVENGITRNLHYIHGGDGLAAIYVKQPGVTDKIYYVHTDHLGSILKLTDAAGTESFKASYNAWGEQTVSNKIFGFHRGYTGHEHLPESGLINMNGRLYDPVLARFMSPDPYVQLPDFSQSYNRYTYCLNNPLSYTDPSGEFWIPIVGMALINGIQSGARSGMNGGSFGKGFLIGAGVTAATMFGAHYAGFLNIPGMMPNGALHGGMNVGVNGVSNMIAGNKFTNGWALSAATGFAHGAYSGYHLSKQQGRNYWWGTSMDKWGYNRGQWSINSWSGKPDVLNFESGEMVAGTQCDAMSFAATHGGTPLYWDDELNQDWTGYTNFYERKNMEFKEIGKDIDQIQSLHAGGYNKAHISVSDYLGPEGNRQNHRMVVKKIKYIPDKIFQIYVLDPGSGVYDVKNNNYYFNKIYDLNKLNGKFKFEIITLYK